MKIPYLYPQAKKENLEISTFSLDRSFTLSITVHQAGERSWLSKKGVISLTSPEGKITNIGKNVTCLKDILLVYFKSVLAGIKFH